MSSVPIFAPDGTLGDIPAEQLAAAVKAGAKPGVHITAPDGSPGVIPVDRTADAVKAGAKIVPFTDQPIKTAGFWHELASDLAGMASGAYKTLTGPDPLADPSVSDADKNKIVAQQQADAAAKIQARRQNQPYPGYADVAAPAAEMLGANVSGMEQSAKEGDPAGVAGHAVAGAAPYVAGAALSVAGPLAKRAILLGKTPEEAYQSALKPSTTLPPAKVARMVQTGLEQEIPVSKAGLGKIAALVDNLNGKIADQIASDPNRPINKFAVTSKLADTARKFATQVNPEADLQAVADSGNEFLRNQPAQIPAADAQAMKQGTYQQLSGKAYGELKGASIEAQKALARGLKDELAKAFPELSQLNAAEGKLLDLQGVLEKAVQREANHQLGGIGTPIAAGAAKAVTGSSGAAAAVGALKAIVDNPSVKSRIAIALSRAGVPAPVAIGRLNAYSAALAASVANNEVLDSRTDAPQQ